MRRHVPSRHAILVAGLLLLAGAVQAADSAPPDGEELARRINARERSPQATRTAKLTLIDNRGRERQRSLLALWKLTPTERKLALFALEPPDLRNQAFLSIDRFDAEHSDDQWLYRPSARRAHRIGDPNRGDSFLGSDFTLEDLMKEDRVEIGEYDWKTLGSEQRNGRSLYRLEQVPKNEELARHLGFARAVTEVDGATWLRRRIRYFGADGKALKTVSVKQMRKVEGFWTAVRIEARNERSGHRSELFFERIDYATPLDDAIFEVRTLERERGPALAGGRGP